jgi:hypothetical protein
LESTKSLATPVLLGINQVTGHPSAPWIHPSHRPPSALWIQPSHRPHLCSLDSSSTLMLLGLILDTNAPWTHPSHQSNPVVSWTHPSQRSTPMVPWNHPSHQSTPVLPRNHPSHWSTPIGVILLHCTRLQYSLHFCTYTLAMQSMVSAFIQHPSKHPSRCIIIGTSNCYKSYIKASQPNKKKSNARRMIARYRHKTTMK